jgi:serine/threonine protein kinase
MQFYICPIYEKFIPIRVIYDFRKNYDSSSQDNTIKKDFQELLQNNSKLQDNILELISKMVNSDPSQRYQNIDDVIAKIDYIEKIMDTNKK